MRDHRAERRAISISDVAGMAGVSTATVSRALSAPAQLRGETLKRVMEAVARTGYRPNIAARSLRAGQSMLVLVVVPDIANPFFADVLRGIEDELAGRGYGLLIGNLGAGGREARMVDVVRAGQVDGVLLLNGHVPARAGKNLLDENVPIVGVCEPVAGNPFPQVAVRNRAAARQAVTHLAELGHRRIAFLGGPAGNVLSRARQQGFREGLTRCGLPASGIFDGDFTFEAGAAAARLLMATRPRPTAVFAANDEMAIGLMKTVRRAGVAVPQELSIVGFDGIAFADYCEPTLTTFRQPRRALGQMGAALLARVMAGERIAPADSQIRLAAELLCRDSSGPAPTD